MNVDSSCEDLGDGITQKSIEAQARLFRHRCNAEVPPSLTHTASAALSLQVRTSSIGAQRSAAYTPSA